MYTFEGQKINGDPGLPPGVSQNDIDRREEEYDDAEGESPAERGAALAFLRSLVESGGETTAKIHLAK